MTNRKCRIPALSVAAVAAVMALLGTSPGVAASATQNVDIKRLTAAVHMTKDDPLPTRSFTGPTVMLAHPTNPRIMVAASADLRTRICYLLRSGDAGQSWHIVGPSVPGLKTYPYCTTATNAGSSQAAIAWGRNNTLYYALGGYGNGEGANDGHSSVLLARSTDLGNTWSTVVVDNQRGQTGPAAADDSGVNGLAVDTSGPRDVVYVGWMQSFPSAPKGSPLENGAVNVAVSTDGGATFGQPVNLNTFSHVMQTVGDKTVPLQMMTYFGGPWLLAHNGVIEAVGGPQSSAAGVSGTGSAALPEIAARSTDQGRTWTVAPLGPPIYSGTGNQTGLGWTPSGGPKGTFVAAYASTPAAAGSSGTANIVVQRSTDEGLTWSSPMIIDNSDPSQQFTSFYPQLGVAPNGRVDVVFEDNVDQHDYHFNVRYTYSTDAGVTWSTPVKVNDQPVNFGLGVSFNSDIRQPPGVASTNQYAAFGWADTRLGNDTTQTQDDFGTVAQFAPLPATSSTVLPIVAAIFGGLLVAGLVLLLAWLVRRRRTEAPEAGPIIQQPEPAGAQ